MKLEFATFSKILFYTLLIGLGVQANEPKIDPNDEAALRKAAATVPMAQPLVDCGNNYLNCKRACQDAQCLSTCAEQNVNCSEPYHFEF